jgi:hypothetical protein
LPKVDEGTRDNKENPKSKAQIPSSLFKSFVRDKGQERNP